jgi:hypothetical protein
LYTYLEKEKKDDTQTYLTYLYGVSKFSLFRDFSQSKIIDGAIDVNQKYAIVTGKQTGDKILNVYLVPSDRMIDALGCKSFSITQA